MILNKIKTVGILTLSACALALPGLAQAELTIHNNTFHPSTTMINPQSGHKKCSNTISYYGITPPHSDNTIPGPIVYVACLGHQHPCKAAVYMTDDCSGEVVADVTFDLDEGIQKIENHHVNGFEINNSGPFEINILGGPPANRK